jgi:hypothetical protein
MDERLKMAIITVATSYCSASPEHTNSIVWSESAAFLVRFYPGIIIDEVLEAFRLAVSGRWPSVDLAAYRGQFSVKILGDVMKAYVDDRNRIRMTADRVLLEMEAESLRGEEAEKSRKAREVFVREFRAMKAAGHVPPLDKILFFWFDALSAAGELSEITDEEKRELWAQAADILKAERAEEALDERMRTIGIRRLLGQWNESGVLPDEWRFRRETIYKKLLMWQVLSNAAMEQVSNIITKPSRMNGDEDIPF